MKKAIRVAVNGYGVIVKRVADNVVADWRPKVALKRGMRLFGAAPEHAEAMRKSGLEVAGSLEDLLCEADVVVDCTPKKVAAKNVETYRRRGLKFIVEGGEKHSVTGHSFVAECNYASALSCARCRRSSAPGCCARRAARCSGAPPIPGKATRAAS